MREQEQFLQVLDRDEAERRFRAAIDADAARHRERSARRGARPRAGGRRHLARRRAVVRSLERRWLRRCRRRHVRRVRGSSALPCSSATKRSTPGVVPPTVIRSRSAVSIATGGMVPRGADAVVMVEHAEVRGRELRCASARSRPAAAYRSPEPTSPRRDGASPRAAADQPRHRSARRDRCRRGRRLAKADRRDPLHRRRDHRARRADAAGQGLRLERAGSRRRRARAGRRAAAAGHYRATTSPRCANACGTRSTPRISCCCPAAPARARATCRIASSPNSAIPASSRTASRSSPASRFASRRPAAGRWSCFPAFRPRRSSPFTSSSRR